ncbi:Kazal-type serine protease inhibitor domain-containing protein [Bartonella sp. HY329]|uniref:Kazal-type serine protease inhibitor family protein n=1 Tax=unclassified Bartonella TaxID=2645622 RepID=UPI0021C67A68|nr:MULTISPECIES: Kazal-type serine protease inhibitor domain-containing protein [unclassified Bartonella]UXM94248.1 Kazal-type serine protease inhibitor domain-containing protein [Bartonella sp. HY329]UXN08571.1 Kazal-type serine protease inhibitor domain-containing protein [Bartonella sp. HY328]
MRIISLVTIVFATIGVLSACNSSKEESDTSAKPCPLNYLPVCGEKNGEQKDFSNRCMAEAAEFKIIKEGTCKPQDQVPADSTPKPLENSSSEQRPLKFACTREYKPVCGVKDGKAETFGNRCMAEAQDFVVKANGPCPAN